MQLKSNKLERENMSVDHYSRTDSRLDIYSKYHDLIWRGNTVGISHVLVLDKIGGQILSYFFYINYEKEKFCVKNQNVSPPIQSQVFFWNISS